MSTRTRKACQREGDIRWRRVQGGYILFCFPLQLDCLLVCTYEPEDPAKNPAKRPILLLIQLKWSYITPNDLVASEQEVSK